MKEPVIKPKMVIKAGNTMTYDKATFENYKRPNFIQVKTAEEMYELFKEDKLLVMDTEDKPLQISSRLIKPPHVRRWIGTGKKAVPVDIPFCLSIGNGKIFASLLDFDSEHNCPEFQKLKGWLESGTFDSVWHNAKFDRHMLANIGINLGGKIHDTVQLTKLVNENRPSFKLRDVSIPYGGIDDFEQMVDLYKATNKIKDYSKLPTELLIQYANADIYNCWVTFKAEYPKLEEFNLQDLYENEIALSYLAYDMERDGMYAKVEYEKPLKDELQSNKDAAENAVYDMAGEIFNMNSGSQLHKIMLKLGVDANTFEYTEKGNVKMDKVQLERFEKMGIPIVEKVQEYKQADKLLTTYAVGIYDQADADNIVHGSINTSEATTGRMSVTKPALQTLPKKNKSIRTMFAPRKGFKMYTFDLDQVEYRLYAHYSQDETLCKMIKDGYDVHTATACILFEKDIKDITPDERQRAKTINFALIYGVGVGHLAELLEVSQTEAARIKQNYFDKLPTAGPFINNVQKVTRQRGYIRNWYNRRRRLTKNECFKAPNALIQGCAADYIKFRAVRIYKFLKMHNYKTRMLMFVHDEIIFEIAEDELFLAPILRWLLSEFKEFRTYITAGCEECCPDWGHKIDRDELGFKELSEEELAEIDAYDIYKRM